MIIAIDGPAGAGKSTIAKEISKKLNITYIDTGAMYRALTWKVINQQIDISDIDRVKELLDKTEIDFIEDKIYLDGEYVEDVIRSKQVTEQVSAVSAIAIVRESLVDKQRKIAGRKSSILDGRDIGTVVFPEADIKIFLTADVAVRAQRRMKENKSKGISSEYNEVEQAIIKRDELDSTREVSPLKKAKDAIEIDTGNKTIEDVTEEITKIIKDNINENTKGSFIQ